MVNAQLDSRPLGDREPRLETAHPFVAHVAAEAPRNAIELDEALEAARRFRHEVVDERALEIDLAVRRDPHYVAHDVLKAAAEAGLFGMIVPKVFGGRGMPLGALMFTLEEVSAGCVGIANLISVHGLALATVAATGDLAGMERVSRLVTEGEREGRPHLLSTALTEPGAGTDLEDADLLRSARLCCEAKPVMGGYRLNGRKVFISNGSIADLHVTVMPTDRRYPVETSFVFLVEADRPGVSVGRVERKMGQKACPAAEIVFDDCFVPTSAKLGSRPVAGQPLDLVLGATRGGVGVFGTGVARGAYERAVDYTRAHSLGGRPMIDHQWVQFRLTDMLRNVMMGRAAYMEAMLSNELFGLSAFMTGGLARELGVILPRSILESELLRRLLTSARARAQADRSVGELPAWKARLSSAFGAEAKVLGSELAVENCRMALDLMGLDGLRHDRGMEKLYRDAKLLMIYEGTNQLNRIEIFKNAIGSR